MLIWTEPDGSFASTPIREMRCSCMVCNLNAVCVVNLRELIAVKDPHYFADLKLNRLLQEMEKVGCPHAAEFARG